MKTLKKTIFYFLASMLLVGCGNKPAVEADYAVIPLPQEITKSEGELFTLNNNTKIVYPKGSDIQKQTAEFLSEYIKFSTGINLKVTDEESADNVIILKADYKADKPESYNLTVNGKQIIINGSDDAGTFYGVQTLRKSMPADATENTVVFPAVDIKDYPRFAYRGMMLDVSRHFFPTEFIKKYIDILALHNINRFHWHITDDQGWRIEIKKHPELTKIGSQREQTVIGRNSGEFDGKPYGGFYTQEEIKDIVAYAQKKFITIIPEVDLPGHMLAALATYPNLGCTGGPYKVSGEWGVFDDVLCAGNDSVYTFLEDVYGEVIELFPSTYIHVGGDECPKVRWKTCPKCQAKIKAEGLKADANHSAEDKLQSYVISRIEKFLNSRGRQIIGWDEILEGGLAPNATVMSWRGMEGGIAAAKQQHNAIMTPNSHLYFDAYQTRDTQDEPLAIGGYTPIEKVYAFEPVPSELSADEQKYIIGTQANLWTEYILDSQHAEYMVLPRIAALAEVQWTEPSKKDFTTFLPRLNRLLKLYDRLGFNYAKHIFDISSKIEPSAEKKAIIVTLATADNAPIYYTLDGTTPTEKSSKYTQPIEIKANADLKAVAIRDGKASKIYSENFSFNKATLKNVTFEEAPNSQYTYNGAITLVDGKRGRPSFGSGEWLGFNKKAMTAIVDLEEPTEVSSVSVGTFVSPGSWIFGARQFTVFVSDDNKTFKQVSDESYPAMNQDQEEKVIDLTATFPTVKTRYVKLVVKTEQSIPAWHAGKGNPAFIFVDEISIN